MASKKKSSKKSSSGLPVRFAPQSQQEDVSLGEAKARFARHGWSANGLRRDLGEDLVVQIFDDGRTTGLSFYAQVKSTTDIAVLTTKNGKFVSYDFEVKDLVHWEVQGTPAVLLVWDISAHRGAWLDVPAAIKSLDKTSKNWRTQTTKTVRIPATNGTDQEGLDALRRAIGNLYLPLFSKGEGLRVKPKFSFSKDGKGQAKLAAFRKVIEEGTGSVTLSGAEITAFKASDWFERAMGKQIPKSITIHPSKRTVRFALQVVATSPKRTEIVSLEMQRTSGGTRQVTFDNHHQDRPVQISLTFPLQNGKLVPGGSISTSMDIEHPSKTIEATLEATRFMIALAEGATVDLKFEGGSLPMASMNHVMGGRSLKELYLWETTLTKLGYVQQRVSRFGAFDLSDGLENSDLQKIDTLYSVVTTGKARSEMTFDFKAKEPPEMPKDKPGIIELEMGDGSIDLLGITIPLGNARLAWEDASVPSAAFRTAEENQSTQITIPSAWVVLTYTDWLPSSASLNASPLCATCGRSSAAGLHRQPATEALHQRQRCPQCELSPRSYCPAPNGSHYRCEGGHTWFVPN